ncbi:MAG: hypothetical protein AAB154_00980, partial [Candidatus Binatota bacterium]
VVIPLYFAVSTQLQILLEKSLNGHLYNAAGHIALAFVAPQPRKDLKRFHLSNPYFYQKRHHTLQPCLAAASITTPYLIIKYH